MVTDCVIKEYKLWDKETNTIADDMKNLLNDGYKTILHYSADGVGRVLLEAVKEEEEKTRTTKSTKKKDTAE